MTVDLETTLARDGFAFLRAGDMRALLGALSDWDAFASSWNGLCLDAYRPERDRLRRHAVLAAAPGQAPSLQPRQPHYQAPQYNALYGGVPRDYEPIEPDVVAGPSMTAVLSFARALFDAMKPGVASWKIELHQVRIEATTAKPGRPTPEGMHRDGVDFVLVMLVRRENVASGTTTVHDPEGRERGAFTLAEPLDAALVDDARVLHGVTPIEPLDPAKPAYRDVLIVTFAQAR